MNRIFFLVDIQTDRYNLISTGKKKKNVFLQLFVYYLYIRMCVFRTFYPLYISECVFLELFLSIIYISEFVFLELEEFKTNRIVFSVP